MGGIGIGYTIYKILKIEKKISQYGACYLLTINAKEGEPFTTFAPASPKPRTRLLAVHGVFGSRTLSVDKSKGTQIRVGICEEDAIEVKIDDEPPN